jgi:hypothetical protein
MKSDEKNPKQQAGSAEGATGNTAQQGKGRQKQPSEHEPHAPVSQGHTEGEDGETTSNKEPTLRSATTDSSRVPKNPHDDMPTGGNIR